MKFKITFENLIAKGKHYGLWGVVVPTAIIVLPLLLFASRFPGFCDQGDGAWCVSAGPQGLAEYVWGGSFYGWFFLLSPAVCIGLFCSRYMNSSKQARTEVLVSYIVILILLFVLSLSLHFTPKWETGNHTRFFGD